MTQSDVRGAAVLTVVFAGLTVLVALPWTPLVNLDTSLADPAYRYSAAHPDWTWAQTVVTNLFSPLSWRVGIVLLAGWLWLRQRRREAAFAITAIVLGLALQELVKWVIGRARPVVDTPLAFPIGLSFPSGHAMTAAVGCGVLLILMRPRLNRDWYVVAVTMAIAIPLVTGVSRIGLAVHWTSDVLGGWMFGTAVVAASHALWLRRDRTPLEPGPD